MFHFGRKTMSPDSTAMLQAIKRERPDLLWIQWSEHAREPERRSHIRNAVDFLSGLVDVHIRQGGAVLVEGKACDLPARDEVFEGKGRLHDLCGPPEHQHWCGLGVRTRADRPLCGEHLVYAHPRWKGHECICERRSANYAADSGEGYEQFILLALSHFGLLQPSNWATLSTEWHDTQRALHTKTGARDYGTTPTSSAARSSRSRPRQPQHAGTLLGSISLTT